ncbi:HNH endonuclease [Rhodococcoides trifolii]|uniref:HNH endonuclease n=1 Tax=Rhodococcoides trifolii TaxID=908250 RepID=UPI001E392424|nr:HNH endonuclease signature motif containing protein [Rhodococcus trifolii]
MGDDGLLRYKWRGEDPDIPDNRALREAMNRQLPLIWFFGVEVAMYQPLFPVYLIAEEPQLHQFTVATSDVAELIGSGTNINEQMKRYIQVQSKRRLHQPVFRASVMQAYGTRCTVCALGLGQLLDAAHIIPDHDEAGIPSVRNGLSLCKIHHAAFDTQILGVRPDFFVEIRTDLLLEHDGPMLQYGLQERHGKELMVLPKSASRPDPTLLDVAYQKFRNSA